MFPRTLKSLMKVIALVVCNLCLLDATEYGADLERRGAEGTDRMGTALAQTGTGSTTPGNPTCKVFSLTLVGDDSYFYACCDGTTITSESEVVHWDCNPNRLTYGTLNESKPFYCGGLGGEVQARKRCDERWGWLATEGCFKWTECFRGVCPLEAEKRGSSADAAFCGDGQCDESIENTENCPADCCPLKNDACLVSNNTCARPCCNEPGCCASTLGMSAGTIWIIICVGVVGGIILLNLICCCCCFCCCRKCCGSNNSRSGVV